MNIRQRYIKNHIANDLNNRMVFIGGPRQVGKTTLSLTFLQKPVESHPAYLNWDNISIRSSLLKGELPPNEKQRKNSGEDGRKKGCSGLFMKI